MPLCLFITHQISIYLADRSNPAYGTVRVIVTDQVRRQARLVSARSCCCGRGAAIGRPPTA